MDKIFLRPATVSDQTILLNLEQKVIEAERPFNASIKKTGTAYYDLKDLLSSDKSLLLVAEIDGRIVATGYAQIRPSKQSFQHEQHCYLGFMYVEPQYRGQGVNKKVLEKLIQWGRGLAIVDFYLDVYSDNKAAISAYKKIGFAESMVEMKLNID